MATTKKPQTKKEKEVGVTKETTTVPVDVPIASKFPTEISEEPKTIKIKYFTNDITKIEKIDVGDWIDLRAAENVTLKSGNFKLVPLGVGMKLPEGYEAHIAPRSSTFLKWGVLQTNSVAVIDESYCGDEDQWFMPVYAARDTEISKDSRICQFRIVKKQPKIIFEEVEHLDEKSRGGFGSTGSI